MYSGVKLAKYGLVPGISIPDPAGHRELFEFILDILSVLELILSYNLNFTRKACRSLDAFEVMVSWHHHDAAQSHRYNVKLQDWPKSVWSSFAFRASAETRTGRKSELQRLSSS